MSTVTDQDYAQYQIDYLRDNLDYLQANIEVVSRYIPKPFIRKHISLWRECVTVQKKHYPKAPTLFTEMERLDLKKVVTMALTYETTHSDLHSIIRRLEDLLKFPQTYFDNYDDMFPPVDGDGKRMMAIREYWDFTLKEKQTNNPTTTLYSEGQVEMDPIDSKRFQNAYKKYVKEWKDKWQSK